ncbi:MAG TPA: trypsin-like peptidase domain-containing protein [Methylomirabilota bacterium]|nr:trypsin-like peptidase domain-containing protein [Methylomirabilota bacterium]
MRRSALHLPVSLFVALVLVSGCGAPLTKADTRTGPVAAPPELARFNELLADLSERLKPALVHVRVRREAGQEEGRDPQEPRRSSGSGFVIEQDGLIVTNAHVVEGVQTAQVRLFDGRRFTARVIGRDNRVDLALLRLEGVSGLPTLSLGDSNRLRVGEFVLALGHPFGLEHTVSFGIVSRKGSPLIVAAPGFDFIQTDAAINPGNSGGPLVSMAGEVVGVNSMAARNGSIGFAIPANLVKMLVPQLAANGRVDWGWLGVSITDVGDDDLGRLRLREARGVLIRSVVPGDPAAQGGVKADDVLLSLDGTRLETPRDLQRVVATTPVGKKVRVTLWRDGREQDVEITIGKYRDPEEHSEKK